MRNARKDLTFGDSLFPVPQAREEKRRWAKRRVRDPMFDKYKAKFVAYSPLVRLSGIQESLVLESGIQLKESRIPLTTGSGIQLLESGVQSLESKTYMGRGVCL